MSKIISTAKTESCHNVRCLLLIVITTFLFLAPCLTKAQTPSCACCGQRHGAGHAVNCRYYQGASSSGNASSSDPVLQALQGILDGGFSQPTGPSAAELHRLKQQRLEQERRRQEKERRRQVALRQARIREGQLMRTSMEQSDADISSSLSGVFDSELGEGGSDFFGEPIENTAAAVCKSNDPAGITSQTADHISSLSDVQLDQEIEVVIRTLKQIGKDSQRNITELNEWAKISHDAQVSALKSSVDLFLDATTDKLKSSSSADHRKFAKRANNIRSKIEDLENLGETASQQEEKKLYEAIKKLVKENEIIAEANNIPVVRLASFSIDYTYDASRWWVARKQILSITDNLDKPGGVLEAQKMLITRHKQLIAERNRRKD